jgi:hypothetical protein
VEDSAAHSSRAAAGSVVLVVVAVLAAEAEAFQEAAGVLAEAEVREAGSLKNLNQSGFGLDHVILKRTG